MIDLNDDRPLRRNPELVAAEMGGDLVMMSVVNGEYYGIGGCGTRIWELLAEPITARQLAASIMREFDVTEDKCSQDLCAFLSELITLGLVRRAA